ncbi:hypothetical protein [Alteromonas sp. H39]|uniref:hypothetical protein n=1 Tax=Alteromonas sp. H39 TaxID=3389876 RepID=UPI0039E1395E
MLLSVIKFCFRALPLAAAVSVFFSVLLVNFLSLPDEHTLTPTEIDDYLHALRSLDLLWIISSGNFWLISLSSEAFTFENLPAFLNAYSALSLLIFCIGLVVYHRTLSTIKADRLCGYFLIMGWMHLLIAKGVLLFTVPDKLIGPVLAVGMLSILYFALAGLLAEMYRRVRGNS